MQVSTGMAKDRININMLSLNVRGIGNVKKRKKLFCWLQNQKANVIFLQETHCTKSKNGVQTCALPISQ